MLAGDWCAIGEDDADALVRVIVKITERGRDEEEDEDEITRRRFRKSCCLVVVMRTVLPFLKTIWLTRGEFAT